MAQRNAYHLSQMFVELFLQHFERQSCKNSRYNIINYVRQPSRAGWSRAGFTSCYLVSEIILVCCQASQVDIKKLITKYEQVIQMAQLRLNLLQFVSLQNCERIKPQVSFLSVPISCLVYLLVSYAYKNPTYSQIYRQAQMNNTRQVIRYVDKYRCSDKGKGRRSIQGQTTRYVRTYLYLFTEQEHKLKPDQVPP